MSRTELKPPGANPWILVSALSLLALSWACGAGPAEVDEATAATSEPPSQTVPFPEDLPPGVAAVYQPWHGDFDEMASRRVVRFLVPASKMLYFLDGPRQRGITYELARQFEEMVNEQHGKGTLKIHAVILPVARDRLLPALLEGRGDIAAGNLTITDDRLELVDFSDPFGRGVRELVVTGPAAPAIETLDDLAATQVHVRASSSYYQSLLALNSDRQAAGKALIQVVHAQEMLEDGDLLEMVNAGLIPAVVVDSHKAQFWAEIFPDIVVHENLALRTDGEIGWAIRKQSPQLRDMVNAFVATHKKGTLQGNILFKRYLQSNPWVRNNLAEEERRRFSDTVDVFRRYSDRYAFEPLLMLAQGYQESRLDQSARSAAGAIGIMQLLESTARDPNVAIDEIHILENNVHAGARYMRFLVDHYFDDENIDDLNKTLLALASYNAGPNRIARLRKETAEAGLDPDRWFGNVEFIVAKRVGREPVQYVSNIYKYFVAYRMLQQSEKARAQTTR